MRRGTSEMTVPRWGFPLDTDPERYIRQQYGKRINEARLRLRSIV